MENNKSQLSAAEPGLKERVVADAAFGPSSIRQISQEIGRDQAKFAELEEAVAELSAKQSELSPFESVKLGVCQYLVGDYEAPPKRSARTRTQAPSIRFTAAKPPFSLPTLKAPKASNLPHPSSTRPSPPSTKPKRPVIPRGTARSPVPRSAASRVIRSNRSASSTPSPAKPNRRSTTSTSAAQRRPN